MKDPGASITQINLTGQASHALFSDLDIHFARLMAKLSAHDDPTLFLAAALVSRATSNGHVCLDLSSLEGRPLYAEEPDSVIIRCPKLKEWRENLAQSAVVGTPGDFRPLILDDHSRLYLYRYWNYENKLATGLRERAVSEEKQVDIPLLRDWLSRLFPPSKDETDWQKVAALTCILKRFCVISGGPGTGKTSLISKILALLLQQPGGEKLQVAMAAPTGKAAARLEQAVKKGKEVLPVSESSKRALTVKASTVHRLLGVIPGSPYFRHNKEKPLASDLVVLDEASMVDIALMSKLVQALPPRAKLILMGDRDQLASVEAGAVLGDICDTGRIHGLSQELISRFEKITGEQIFIAPETEPGAKIKDCVVHLKKSYRFGPESGIARVGEAINKGKGSLALNLVKAGKYHDIKWKALPRADALHRLLRETVLQGYKEYLEAVNADDILALFERFRILCALRRGDYGVATINRRIEEILKEEGLISEASRWYRGRPVLISRNDYNLALFNGETGIILPDPDSGDDLRAFFLSHDGAMRKFLPARLPDHETAYAMTVHKSQGSEFDSAVFILPDKSSPVLTRELLYTGLTRARKEVEIWGTEEVFIEGISRPTVRASGLRDALWGP